MKKILLMTVWLMSLLGVLSLSSCDDKSTFVETDEFAPEYYVIKDDTHISVIGSGTSGLVIEEAEKTDWDIYVPFKCDFGLDKPLEITEADSLVFIYSKTTKEIEISTNAGPFSVAVGGLTYGYTYMGEQLRLFCASALAIRAEIQEDVSKREENPFHEEGKIVLTLESEDFVLSHKEMPFEVDDY